MVDREKSSRGLFLQPMEAKYSRRMGSHELATQMLSYSIIKEQSTNIEFSIKRLTTNKKAQAKARAACLAGSPPHVSV